MSASVEWSARRRRYVVIDEMDAEEARNCAYLWGPGDGAYDELLQAAAECDRLNGEEGQRDG